MVTITVLDFEAAASAEPRKRGLSL